LGDILKPDAQGRSTAQLRKAMANKVRVLQQLIGEPPRLSDGFSKLNIHAGSKKTLLNKLVMPLENYFASIDADNFVSLDLMTQINQWKQVQSKGRSRFDCLVPIQWLKKGENLSECPGLPDIAKSLQALDEDFLQYAYSLAGDSIKRLQKDAEGFKRQNGLISYNDMLNRLDTALRSSGSRSLLQKVRNRYKVAFVDEFQDTDITQWRIFKRLFIGSPAGLHTGRLFLIGDPKQAIYAFRGADVYAYLQARQEMERLAQNNHARLYSLTINWRSQPALVKACNKLFGNRHWFGSPTQPSAFAIGYHEVGSPPDPADQLPSILAQDHSKRTALTLIDLRDAGTLKKAKPMLARRIAAEICHLVEHSQIKIRGKNGACRDLSYGDICILVRGKPDAQFLESELAARTIPFSFYKKPGLFFSEEAYFLSLILHAIIDPANAAEVKKALLTPFFAIKAEALFDYESLPINHPLKQLLYRWHETALKRYWGRLFQSVMEDSGFLFREAVDHNWDRKYTNYFQLFEHLQSLAYRDNLDLRALVALLDGYRRQTIRFAEDTDIHQIETEAPKVQIMTMHVSKGLEFPVVFIAGGLTKPFIDEYHVFHDYQADQPEAGIRKVIDLTKSYGKQRHAMEKIEEDKRLFYVSLTRAQLKLYVPFLPATTEYAWLGPLCRFVAAAMTEAFLAVEEDEAVGWLPMPLSSRNDTTGELLSMPIDLPQKIKIADQLRLPTSETFLKRSIKLSSFSSLHRGQDLTRLPSTGATGFQTKRLIAKEDDENETQWASIPRRGLPIDKEIPGGTEIGSMFHDILENIDYVAVTQNPSDLLSNPANKEAIEQTLGAYRIAMDWQPEVCRIVANTLTTPVTKTGAVPLILGLLNKEDRLHEVGFTYPLADLPGRLVRIPECDLVNGPSCFIRGYIDLVFRHQDKYYIADWKSNRLDQGYGPQAMQDCMDAAGYHLQYKLYTLALLRWLQQALGARFDAGRDFGGVYYFFLRGMGIGNGHGVYYVAPSQLGTADSLAAEIADWNTE
jgi:exodeoxyribonuclease V beta subunit